MTLSGCEQRLFEGREVSTGAEQNRNVPEIIARFPGGMNKLPDTPGDECRFTLPPLFPGGRFRDRDFDRGRERRFSPVRFHGTVHRFEIGFGFIAHHAFEHGIDKRHHRR